MPGRHQTMPLSVYEAIRPHPQRVHLSFVVASLGVEGLSHQLLPLFHALSHGDLCDTNVFVDAHDQLHFIDLGRGGIADRWLDIAFAHRNLREDVSDNAANNFLRGLGEPEQSAKRVFFEQLDELF